MRRRLVTALAGVLLLVLLLLPDRVAALGPAALMRLPVEGLVAAALVLAWPAHARRAVAVTAAALGGVVGLLAVWRLFDLTFDVALARPFDPVVDRAFLGHAVGFLSAATDGLVAAGAVVLVVVLAVALVVAAAAAGVRVAGVTRAHRRGSTGLLGLLAVVWIVGAVTGWSLVPGEPVAAREVAVSAADHARASAASLRDSAAYEVVLAADPLRAVPGERLLTRLRGKDVLLLYVESYGRAALEDADVGPGVRRVLADGERRLTVAGYTAASAWLTSPTTGGGSWLAHSTVQSGTWVSNQQRYDALLGSQRLTLSHAFGTAGWRTVAVLPGTTAPWPEGKAYFGWDSLLIRDDLGYRGPTFGWASMPDQFVLAQLQARELALGQGSAAGGSAGSRSEPRTPVMAQVELVSSHAPWAPLPRMVPWADLGDGSVFDPMPAQGAVEREVWRAASSVRREYGHSVEYTLSAVQSFLATYGTDDTVAIVLGDHQPATVVTGPDASRDVPVTIVAKDPAVVAAVRGLGWSAGLSPTRESPVWGMDAFRDRFVAAYS